MIFSYRIEGMHCQSCVQKITSALEAHAHSVTVTLNPPRLILESDRALPIDNLNARLSEIGSYQAFPLEQTAMQNPVDSTNPGFFKLYYPIFLIFAYLSGITLLVQYHHATWNLSAWMSDFMAGFFLIFSAFKLFDLKGFASGYASYDLLAKRFPVYGFIYPFLELGLGLAYLTQFMPLFTNSATLILMGFSTLGVLHSLSKKQTLRCACLGTVLNVPISSITVIEDLLMVVMAGLSLWMQ